ncbi:ribonuclease H-like domain-containing protein [Tanacetum coccineum]
MWRLRIEQYFQVQDYALWDVIENGNSFKPTARTTANADGTSTSMIPGPVTTEEKAQKKNDVKERSMLLMALPNEHQLTFNQYKDAKTLFDAIQTRFGGNDATRKTQKTLLKKMYENFNAPSTESLPFEWNTHVVVWKNKSDLDTMSIDDLYNNFKIVEQEVKRIVTSSSNSNSSSHNMAFVSSPSSTNEVNTANRTSKKTTINGSDTAGYDKSKVECFNCHKMGHFARECRGPRNQDNRNKNQNSSRRPVNMEKTSSKAMVAIDGASFD